MKRCLELYKIREELIPIFILINEREKKVFQNIKGFINLPTMNKIQSNYLESLIQNMKNISEKISNKITQLTNGHPIIGNSFLINGMVSI